MLLHQLLIPQVQLTVPTSVSNTRVARPTRKDKSLKEVLDLMDGDFAPIIPDAVTDYYLAKMDLRHRI